MPHHLPVFMPSEGLEDAIAAERAETLRYLSIHEAAHATVASALGLSGKYSAFVSKDGGWFHREPRSEMIDQYFGRLASPRDWVLEWHGLPASLRHQLRREARAMVVVLVAGDMAEYKAREVVGAVGSLYYCGNCLCWSESARCDHHDACDISRLVYPLRSGLRGHWGRVLVETAARVAASLLADRDIAETVESVAALLRTEGKLGTEQLEPLLAPLRQRWKHCAMDRAWRKAAGLPQPDVW